MGIVKKVLASFELPDGRTCRIEENVGGEIHIHIGDIRLDLTADELEDFAEIVGEARETLHDTKEWN